MLRLTLVLSVLAVSGCALRPRYADFVTANTPGKEVTFVVLDAATSKPVAGAKIEVSELKNRINATTSADGTFKLPVDKKYLDENSIIVVNLPKDVTSYRVEVAKPPPSPPAPVEAPMPAVDAADAGSNG